MENDTRQQFIDGQEANKLDCPKDFEWYKHGIDNGARYHHRHYGEPKRYPCLVRSEWSDDPNGPYTYTHSFIYQTTVKTRCEHCGHESHTKEWDWRNEDFS